MTIHSGTTPSPGNDRVCEYVTIMPCERSHKRKLPTTPLPLPAIKIVKYCGVEGGGLALGGGGGRQNPTKGNVHPSLCQ